MRLLTDTPTLIDGVPACRNPSCISTGNEKDLDGFCCDRSPMLISKQRSGLSSGQQQRGAALLLWLLSNLQGRLHGLWWQPLVERRPAETALQSTWCWCARTVRPLGRVNPLTECYP